MIAAVCFSRRRSTAQNEVLLLESPSTTKQLSDVRPHTGRRRASLGTSESPNDELPPLQAVRRGLIDIETS
eukprot:scaffold559_cov190-Alexandrium_tamarense.AAC.34